MKKTLGDEADLRSPFPFPPMWVLPVFIFSNIRAHAVSPTSAGRRWFSHAFLLFFFLFFAQRGVPPGVLEMVYVLVYSMLHDLRRAGLPPYFPSGLVNGPFFSYYGWE